MCGSAAAFLSNYFDHLLNIVSCSWDVHVYVVSQKKTLMLHTMTSVHINRFW